MMSKKCHLTESEAPLPERQPVRTFCDQEIPNPHFEFRTEPGELEIRSLSTLLFCRDCIAKLMVRLTSDGIKVPLAAPDEGGTKTYSLRTYLYGVRAEQLEEAV